MSTRTGATEFSPRKAEAGFFARMFLRDDRLSLRPPDARELSRMHRVLEALFCLNVAFAITSLLFIYDGAHHLVDAPKIVQECLESFSGILAHIAPLALHQHKNVNVFRSEIIRNAIFAGLTFAIALLLLLPLRLVTGSFVGRRIFIPVSGVAAAIAVPGCWLYIVRATWSDYEPNSFRATYGYAALLEIVVIAAVLWLVRDKPVSYGTSVFALHYTFWILLMLPHVYSPVMALPLSLVFPASAVAWLRYVRDPLVRNER